MKLILLITNAREKYSLELADLDITVGEVKKILNSQYGVDVDPEFMKLVINGKIRKNEDKLSDCGVKVKEGQSKLTIKGTLLFEKGHFDRKKGNNLLKKSDQLLENIEKELKDIKARIKNRMIKKEDTFFDLASLQEKLMQREAEIEQSKVNTSDAEERELKLKKIKQLLEMIEAIRG